MIFSEELFDLKYFEHHALFEDLDYVWEVLNRLEAYIAGVLENSRGSTHVEVMAGAVVGQNVILGEGVIVEPHAYIKGPAIISDGTEIRHGAYIRENVIIGRDCIIGNATEVKHSILMNGVHASHWNYIGDSILGFDVNLGAGTKLSNKKITGTEIFMRDANGNRYGTGLSKLGAIIGDGTQIGCNAVLNPGTLLGKRCLIYPLVSARGTHPHGAIVKT